jgi:YVTN family beta-propeller protein
VITPDGTQAYVTNAGTNTVSVINTSTNTVTTTVPVGANPVSAAIF